MRFRIPGSRVGRALRREPGRSRRRPETRLVRRPGPLVARWEARDDGALICLWEQPAELVDRNGVPRSPLAL